MALNLTKTLPTGVVLTYHRILSARIDYDTNRVEMQIGSYISEEARRSGKTPVEILQTSIALGGETIASDPRAWIYDKALVPMVVFDDPTLPEPAPGQPPLPSRRRTLALVCR